MTAPGFYRIAFTGAHGSGLGIIVLQNGIIVGADVGGATYDGSYDSDPVSGLVRINAIMRAPAGLTPVQTGVPLITPADIPIQTTITLNAPGGTPVLIDTPLGKVNVIFSKIREFN